MTCVNTSNHWEDNSYAQNSDLGNESLV